LLIRGQGVDTGDYSYLATADEMIKDPISCIKMQRLALKNENDSTIKSKIFAKYCIAHESEIDAAIDAAYIAYEEFRYFSFSKRAKILNDIYELLLDNKKRLLELLILEGHPETLALWEFAGMETAYRPECINYFKTQLRGSFGIHNNESLGWIRKPDGVIVVSPPGNASCSNSMTAGFALLGGNTLIIKPPLRAPIATLYLWHEVFWKALAANHAPKGTINTLVGNSSLIMEKWLSSPYVSDVFFFGDSSTGMRIGARAFQAGKKPILELSGNDALIVWKDANIKLAAESLSDAFLGSTQICMVPKKAFVHECVYDQFETDFLAEIKNFKYGLPSAKGVVLTPVVKAEEFFEFLDDAISKGAILISGGKKVNHEGKEDSNGLFIQPTVLRITEWEKALSMKCVREENFFPLIPLICVRGGVKTIDRDSAIFKAMVGMVNQNHYGLRTSVWVDSAFYTAKFIKKLDRSGLLRINSRHTGFSPFLTTHGGPGLSGGPFGEANYVWQKTTHLQNISVTKLPLQHTVKKNDI
jgi:acyl-CoA reductase-like NAD-dependent aldehyde dehydrogenase